VLWHHKQAATSCFFNSDRFINYWNIQLSYTCNSIFVTCVVHHIILLYNSWFAVSNFLFAQLAEEVHSTSRILLYKPCKLYQSFSYKSSEVLIRSFPNLGCIGSQKRIPEIRSAFSELSNWLPVPFSAYTKCTHTPMLCKIT